MAFSKVKKNINTLRALCHLKKKQAKSLLQASDKQLIGCICECVHNVANGNVKISQKSLEKIQKHKSKIRKIIGNDVSYQERKKLIVQSGGFLPLLLAPIVSLVGGLVGEAIGGAISKRNG
jgi:hypothetical protein